MRHLRCVFGRDAARLEATKSRARTERRNACSLYNMSSRWLRPLQRPSSNVRAAATVSINNAGQARLSTFAETSDEAGARAGSSLQPGYPVRASSRCWRRAVRQCCVNSFPCTNPGPTWWRPRRRAAPRTGESLQGNLPRASASIPSCWVGRPGQWERRFAVRKDQSQPRSGTARSRARHIDGTAGPPEAARVAFYAHRSASSPARSGFPAAAAPCEWIATHERCRSMGGCSGARRRSVATLAGDRTTVFGVISIHNCYPRCNCRQSSSSCRRSRRAP